MPLNSFRVSALGQTLAFALLVGVLAITPMAPVDAQKGPKPPSNPPASVTFADAVGDRMISDTQVEGTHRPYANGAEGVEATVFTASGDLVLQLGSTRRINVVLADPMQLSNDGPKDGAPVGPVVSAGTFYVSEIGFVPVGESRAKLARLGGFTTLANHAMAYTQITRGETLINGTPVCVTRHAPALPAQWTISTSADGTCPGPMPIDQPTPGEVAGMWSETTVKGKVKQTFVARYRIPFTATVTCLENCPAQ